MANPIVFGSVNLLKCKVGVGGSVEWVVGVDGSVEWVVGVYGENAWCILSSGQSGFGAMTDWKSRTRGKNEYGVCKCLCTVE